MKRFKQAGLKQCPFLGNVCAKTLVNNPSKENSFEDHPEVTMKTISLNDYTVLQASLLCKEGRHDLFPWEFSTSKF